MSHSINKPSRTKEIIYLCLFIFFSVLILAESLVPSTGSSSQSKILAWMFDTGPKTTTIINPTSLSVNSSEVIYVGYDEKLEVTVLPEDTSDKRYSVQINSGSDCLSYSEGFLKGLKEGTSEVEVISLSDNTVKASKTISVQKKTLTSLELSFKNENFYKGHSYKYSFKGDTKDLKYSDLLFKTSYETVAIFDSVGYLHTLKTGTVTAYIESKYNSSIKSPAVSINVKDFASIDTTSIKYIGLTLVYEGESFEPKLEFNASATDTNFIIQDQTSFIYDETNLKALKIGTYSLTFISVFNTSLQVTTDISVKEVKAKGIDISESSIQYGKAINLAYKLVPEVEGLNVSNKEVEFMSSDSSIASIDESGVLLGYKKGNVDISVKWKEDTSINNSVRISVTSMDGEQFDNINYWTRKILGHFLFFFFTGLTGLLYLNEVLFKNNKLRLLFISLISSAYGLVLAIGSELCQMAAKGRYPSFKDVMIDFSGYVLGTLIIAAVFLIILYKRKKKEESDKDKVSP